VKNESTAKKSSRGNVAALNDERFGINSSLPEGTLPKVVEGMDEETELFLNQLKYNVQWAVHVS
jgi:hypothetical protein